MLKAARRRMPEYLPDFQKGLDAVLRIDPSLRNDVESNQFPSFFSPRPAAASSFEYLSRSVISQQVSGAAARAICGKFLALCGLETGFPTPTKVLEYNIEQLRSAGLSMRKAEYVRGLAEAYEAGEISDKLLQSLDDDDVVDKIVSMRGFGPWSAQMFLIFYLYRMDVFSPGDVGVQRGMRAYLKQRPEVLKEVLAVEDPPQSPGKSKKARAKQAIPPDLKHMERVAHRFAPHRTAFQMVLWKLSDIKMDTVEARDGEIIARAANSKQESESSGPAAATKQETAEPGAVNVPSEQGTATVEAQDAKLAAKPDTTEISNKPKRAGRRSLSTAAPKAKRRAGKLSAN